MKDIEKQLLEIRGKPRMCGVTELKGREFLKDKGSEIERSNRIRLKNVYWICNKITTYLHENDLNGMLGTEAI